MLFESILVENLRLDIDRPEDDLPATAARKLGIDASAIEGLEIVRRALDARKKRDIHHRYHVLLELSDRRLRRRLIDEGLAREPRSEIKNPLDREIIDGFSSTKPIPATRPVVVGSGPGGLFTAWLLAREGRPPVVLERGPEVAPRVRAVRAFERGGPHDPENNILFGEGGAGTFSDGKLTSRKRTPLAALIHRLLVESGAPEEILVDSKPHIGTDRLRAVLIRFRDRLRTMGVEFRFRTKMTGLERSDDGRIAGVMLENGESLPASSVFLVIGHSARDTFEVLHAVGVPMEFKPFQLGLRIEHPQQLIDRAQFGDFAPRLPAAEYVLSDSRRGVFSFCMCPGGEIVASVSEPEHLCTNGMSRRLRNSGRANSALVVTVGAGEVPGASGHPLAGIDLQRRLEHRAFDLGGGDYGAPGQRARDFVRGRRSPDGLESSYRRGVVSTDLREILPASAAEAIRNALEVFDRRIAGYLDEGLLVGPETRGSSPVRVPRNPESRQAPAVAGLFPVGEGAGHAGGIMSAAIDGLRSAAVDIRG